MGGGRNAMKDWGEAGLLCSPWPLWDRLSSGEARRWGPLCGSAAPGGFALDDLRLGRGGGCLQPPPLAGPSFSLRREGGLGGELQPGYLGEGASAAWPPPCAAGGGLAAGSALEDRCWGRGRLQPPAPAGGRGGGRPAGSGSSCIGGCGEGGGQEAGGQGGARVAGGGVSMNRVGVFSAKEERKVCGGGGAGAAKRAGPGPEPAAAAAALVRGAAAGGPPLDFCRGGGIAPSFSSPQG